MPVPKKPTPEKYCMNCNTKMERKDINGRLEDLAAFKKRKYCNRSCMAEAYEGVIKNKNSRNYHRQSAKTVKQSCEVCGSKIGLHVHHVDENGMNNSVSNLMTLCSSCHREAHSKHFSAPKVRVTCKHCEKPAMKNSLCWKHNTRYQKYGNPLMTKKKIGSEWRLITEDGF